MCAGNALFCHTRVVSESKIAREMLCFTMETAVGGCEGRRCERAVAAVVAYASLCSPNVGSVLHWEVQSQVVKRIVMVGCLIGEWQCRFPWWRGVIGESHCKWLNAM